ncbi:MAG: hypothetical protein JNL67_14340 [Planctomycetaceae bacterium]|nr:hypothetical protein [Planctomycetaceae bacterium]
MSRFKSLVFNLVWIGSFIQSSGIGASPLPLRAQEAVTHLDQPGTFNKHLTPGMMDRWVFAGKKGQLLIAGVATNEFDATLKLVQVVDGTEHPLREVDDEGSNANLAFRLPGDGEYKLLVHGFEFKGGGNYSVSLEQVPVSPVVIGERTSGSFDEQGTAWLYFNNAEDSYVTVDFVGGGGAYDEVRDSQGLPIESWAGMVRLERAGEYYVRLNGARDRRFELQLHRAKQQSLEKGTMVVATLNRKSASVFEISGRDGSFGLVEVEASGDLASRLILPTRSKLTQQAQLMQFERGPQMLEVPSKGRYRRYAMVWKGDETYQLQLASERGADVQVRFFDPRQNLAPAEPIEQVMPVGGTQFFKVVAEQGQSLTLTSRSSNFDCYLRLYSKTGQPLAWDDDGGGAFDAKIRYMPFANSELTLAVSSRGDGGGGSYTLQAEVESPKVLQVHVKDAGRLAEGETGFYSLEVNAGQKLLLHLQSDHAQAGIQLLNANGVELASATSGQSRDAVLVHEFADGGRFAVAIKLAAAGEFQLRAIEAN